MRYILYILLVVSSFYSYGSHFIGGEITYKYLTGNTYEVNITLFRDCNDCKLGKDGGGTSTESCANLKEAYIRTVAASCGNENIGSIKLSKLGFENITKICDPEQSKCGPKGNYLYGVEAHYYQGTIDFSKYNKYTGCGFHIFFNISERSDEFSNLLAKEDDLYNYAYIDPWKENISSPSFISSPQVIFPVNTTVYTGDYVSNSSGDSIVYKLGSPLKDHNTPLVYSDNFSFKNFTTAHCDGSSFPCNDNPSSYPPTGISLNRSTGALTFTPINQNELSTRVIEVEQWRKHNGQVYLAGKVRRDVMVFVTSPSNNESPIIKADEVYYLCENQIWETTITVLDLDPITGLSSADSVEISIEHELAGLNVSKVITQSAPFQETKLQFTPTKEHIGTHIITIFAKDDNCPEYGESVKQIRLVISPKPSLNLTVEEKFCGNNEIAVSGGKDAKYRLDVSDSKQVLISDSFTTNFFVFRHQNSEELNITVFYKGQDGCKDTLRQSRQNLGTVGLSAASIIETLEFCPGDSLIATLNHDTYVVDDINWVLNDSLIFDKKATLRTVAHNGSLKYSYYLVQDELKCYVEDSSTVIVNKGPSISVPPITPYCFSDKIDLGQIDLLPNSGTWRYEDNEIEDRRLDISKITANKDTTISLRYTIEPTDASCGSTAHIAIPIREKPLMQLANTQICGEGGNYRLTNSILRPFHYSTENIVWEVLNEPSLLSYTPYPTLNIEASGGGIFTVVATNTFNNGCITKDTASIKVDSALDLTYNQRKTICQSDEAIDISAYFDVNIEGGFWQIKNDFDFYGDNYVPKECRDFTFQYFYHKNGCHNELDIPVSTICKPNFNIAIDDIICQDYQTLVLENDKQWTLQNAPISELNPSEFELGNYVLKATKINSGCSFDTFVRFSIVEPLNFELINLPSSLCEGDELKLVYDGENKDIKLNLAFCDFSTDVRGTYSYKPSSCDLNREEIRVLASSVSQGMCPSHTKLIEIPFHPIPRIFTPKIVSGCEPFELNFELDTKPSDTLNVRWTVTNGRTNRGGTSSRVSSTDKLYADKYSLNLSLENQHGCLNFQSFKDIIRVAPKPDVSFSMANSHKLNLSDRTVSLYNYSSIPEGDLNHNWFYAKRGSEYLFSQLPNPVYTLPSDTGIFEISLISTSEKECKDTATHQVLIVPDIIAFIPSAFSPNNKGPETNNEFRVQSDHAASYRIVIFNKWGQKVYQSHDITESWDGTYNGQFCQSGIYVYAIKLTNHSGEEYTYEGTINLIR